MLRKRGQKSLYEAISKARGKTSPNKPPVEYSPPQEVQPVQQEREPVKQKIEEPPHRLPVETAVENVEQKFEWPKKPRAATFIDGRLELSMSYIVAVVLGLVLILVLLLFFRLGQIYGSPSTGQNKQAVKTNLPPPEGAGIYSENANPLAVQAATAANASETAGKGSNRIVIKIYSRQQDLAPAKDFFDKNGIETEIIQDSTGVYKLVTKSKNFNNPNSAGTDGYQVKQKIIEVGKDYKAPQGFEQFKFNDPYGEKVP